METKPSRLCVVVFDYDEEFQLKSWVNVGVSLIFMFELFGEEDDPNEPSEAKAKKESDHHGLPFQSFPSGPQHPKSLSFSQSGPESSVCPVNVLPALHQGSLPDSSIM